MGREYKAGPPKSPSQPISSPGFSEETIAWDWNPQVPDKLFLNIGPGGRIVIPSAYRNAMDIKQGDRLMVRLIDGELRLVTPRRAVEIAQQMVRESIPGDRSLVDALMEYRQQELDDDS